jgi:hypothetical protein
MGGGVGIVIARHPTPAGQERPDLGAPDIADIARDRKNQNPSRGGDTDENRESGDQEDFPLDPHFPCDYNIRVRILHVDKQAVSGVPELHWRQYEHHFVQRRAARERPT